MLRRIGVKTACLGLICNLKYKLYKQRVKVKNIVFFLIFLPIFSAESKLELTDPVQPLCVQTLNTYGMFYSNNLEERHQKTLSFLRQYECDIILLQEVWQDDHYRNLERLSQDINMKSIYFRKPNDNKKSGLVGLFKGQVQDSDVFYFPSVVRSGLDFLYDIFKAIDKGFGMAQVSAPWTVQDSFLVFNFHLDHTSQRERVSQLLLYLKRLLENSYSDQVIIIAGGDFNFDPSSIEFRMMTKLLQFKDPYEQIRKNRECTHLCKDGGYNFLNFFLGEGIKDYIFFRSSSQIDFEPQDIFIFPKDYNDVFLSDHFGLRAIFHLENSFENHFNSSISSKLLDKRVKDFSQTLSEVESFLKNKRGARARADISFVRSLHKDLENSQSRVVQYLEY